MPQNGDIAPISYAERIVKINGVEWKCRPLTLGDYAQVELHLAYAPVRAGIPITGEEIQKRSIVTCHSELSRLDNILYIFWLSVKHNNVTYEEVCQKITIKDLDKLYKITSELSGLGGENPF
jgi:hypothetical protein